MQQDNPQQADLAYAAGYFDGEGTVSAYLGSGPNRNSLVFKVSIAQSDFSALEWFAERFGGTVAKKPMSKLGKLPHFEWHLTMSNAYEFLKILEPYVRQKHSRVVAMLEIWECRSDREKLETLVAARGFASGRAAAETEWNGSSPYAAVPRDAEHCRNGHSRTSENTYRNSQGVLLCRICRRERRDATVRTAGMVQPAEVAEMPTRQETGHEK